MNLISQSAVKNLLKTAGLRPSRRLGQNFLVDKRVLEKIVAAADLGPEDTVLEIGPGLGALTQELAKKAGKVIAIEKDPKMCEILKETLKNHKNVEVIRGDIRFLEIRSPDIAKIFGRSDLPKYKIVSNLPFYLTAPVIRKFLELADTRCLQMTLVVQKEVGQRICSKPPDMNLLAVSVQFYAKPEIVSYISKNSFWPQPKVDAAIIKITPRAVDRKSTIIEKTTSFFRIVRAGFSQPRKQLINNLSKGLKIDKKKVGEWLLENGIKSNQRAETLSVEDWLCLVKTFD